MTNSGEPIEPEIVAAGKPSFFHPLSGAIILAVDWLAFGLDLFSDFAALLVVGVVAFAATYYGVYWTQARLRGDSPKTARWKAFLGGLAAGVPFPITGTIVGAAILTLSGLPSSLPKKKN